jgi:hypothetical protein
MLDKILEELAIIREYLEYIVLPHDDEYVGEYDLYDDVDEDEEEDFEDEDEEWDVYEETY